jgi:hypothetical protein
MILSKEAVEAYKTLITDPKAHGLDFKPLEQCFEKSDTCRAQHLLFEDYVAYINKPLPKVIFYIIIQQIYGNCTGIDTAANNSGGYFLKLNPN